MTIHFVTRNQTTKWPSWSALIIHSQENNLWLRKEEYPQRWDSFPTESHWHVWLHTVLTWQHQQRAAIARSAAQWWRGRQQLLQPAATWGSRHDRLSQQVAVWDCRREGSQAGWRMNDNEVCAGSSRSLCFSLLNAHSLKPLPLLMHMYNVWLWQHVWGSAFYRFGNVRRCTLRKKKKKKKLWYFLENRGILKILITEAHFLQFSHFHVPYISHALTVFYRFCCILMPPLLPSLFQLVSCYNWTSVDSINIHTD